MKKRLLAMCLTLSLLVASLAGCGGGGDSSTSSGGTSSAAGDSSVSNGSAAEVDETQYPGLTDQEKEAVSLGLINLDGTMPIIPDPDAFEEKYGKIKYVCPLHRKPYPGRYRAGDGQAVGRTHRSSF